MPNISVPRRGSMQFYPRKRASRTFARVRYRLPSDQVAEFAGYKVGMTHVGIVDNGQNSATKGEEISMAVTVLECPPLKVLGVRGYKNGLAFKQIMADQLDKHLGRRLRIPKSKGKSDFASLEGCDSLTLVVHTQPHLAGFGKKVPDVFEVVLGGSKEAQVAKARELLGKEIPVNSVFADGQTVDVHAITKGKGYQGPVKRFGIGLRSHKSEKTKRGPGSLGGWSAQGHVMYRVAHAGQMGYHQRKELNKWVVQIGTDPKRVNPKGGFVRYGLVKSQYMLLKGSVPGSAKRLIRMTRAVRANRKIPHEAPSIEYVSLESKQ
jgi:large subunit ribosomal protein L3